MTPSGFDYRLIDRDALDAVRRLQERNYEAYLVGGCVRDLLLEHRPKDFDIATSARPQHVRRCFPRNCRIIGRRFKLAHLHYADNTKILEVSTFRRPPPEVESTDSGDDGDDEDLLITHDNEFGTAREDALRRDFTVNSLLFDPINDTILDFTGGLADIDKRLLRTIGDPVVRFREDPVRILRATKFHGRIGLDIESGTFDAMREVAPDLVRAAPPRVLEEILRLLRGGHALVSFQLLRDVGALEVILPTIEDYLQQADRAERVLFWRTLEALDGAARYHAAGGLVDQARDGGSWPPESGLVLGTLFTRPVQFAVDQNPKRSPTSIAEQLISPFAQDYRLPRRDTGCLKRICGVQHRFFGKRRARFQVESFLQDPYFDPALQLFAWTSTATGQFSEELELWQDRAGSAPRRDSGDADSNDLGDSDSDRSSKESRDGKRGDPSRKDGKRKDAKRKDGKRKDERNRDRQGKSGRKQDEKPRKDKKDKRQKKPKKTHRERGRSDHVETIEPEAVDLSAFEVELDPKRVPTFGSIVEGSRKKQRTIPAPEADDTYKPPPAPDTDSPPPAPPSGPDGGDDVFGDW